jgi:thiol-disulfide isomerase/thioredoxin
MGEVVPACSIVNDRVTTLTLTDLDGRTWDFHRDHTGRLVLIDFWGTWCVPCLRAVPLLNSLESAYGRYGLQVVGIACERDERSPSERARRVSEVVEKMKIRYKVLLAEDRERDPVQRQFRIREYPYLVLLDGEGNILWRGGSSGLRELEAILHRRLNAP